MAGYSTGDSTANMGEVLSGELAIARSRSWYRECCPGGAFARPLPTKNTRQKVPEEIIKAIEELSLEKIKEWIGEQPAQGDLINGSCFLGYVSGDRLISYFRYGHVAYFNHSCTPLHLAVHITSRIRVKKGGLSSQAPPEGLDIIRVLLEAGANPCIKDGWEHDVFDLGCTDPDKAPLNDVGIDLKNLGGQAEVSFICSFARTQCPDYQPTNMYTGEKVDLTCADEADLKYLPGEFSKAGVSKGILHLPKDEIETSRHDGPYATGMACVANADDANRPVREAKGGRGKFVVSPSSQCDLSDAGEKEWHSWSVYFMQNLLKCPVGSAAESGNPGFPTAYAGEVDEPTWSPLGIGACFACTTASLQLFAEWPRELPEELCVGLWERHLGESLDAFARLSNGTSDASRIAFSVDTPLGKQAFGFTETMPNFVLANNDAMRLFMASNQGKLAKTLVGDPGKYVPMAKQMSAFFADMAKLSAHTHVLSKSYYSMTPYKCGPGFVKYALRPRQQVPFVSDDINVNMASVRTLLAKQDHEFDFCIQVARDPVAHPIEDASVKWDEDISPYVPIGTLRFPAQDTSVFQPIQNVMKFHSLETLPEHAALGTINHIRSYLYSRIMPVRIGHVNGKPDGEPAKCPFGFGRSQ